MSRAEEWCSLSTAPVYPHRYLTNGDGSGSPEGTRLSRREALLLVRNVHPGTDREFCLRNLPCLRAVIALPRQPRIDHEGSAVPALWLEHRMRRRRAVFPGVRRPVGGSLQTPLPKTEEFCVETSRGYDRYLLGPQGLLDCGHVDYRLSNEEPPRCIHLDRPGTSRRVFLRRHRGNPGLHRISDGIALACAVLAMVLRVLPGADFGSSGDTGAVSTTGGSGTAAEAYRSGTAPAIVEIAGNVPGLFLTTVSREGGHLRLEGEIPGDPSSTELMARLMRLLPRYDLSLEHLADRSVISMEGEGR